MGLAFLAGLSQGEISRYERRRAQPSPRHLERLSVALGLLPDELLDDVQAEAEAPRA